jgi:hypothetical protein
MSAQRGLSIKTKLEMARGALKTAVNPDLAILYVNRLERVRLGQEKLWTIFPRGYRRTPSLYRVEFEGHDKLVTVTVGEVVFKEHVDKFPTDTLIAQVILLCG